MVKRRLNPVLAAQSQAATQVLQENPSETLRSVLTTPRLKRQVDGLRQDILAGRRRSRKSGKIVKRRKSGSYKKRRGGNKKRRSTH